ncbi:hypothetical protein DE146DRAFT_209055 [Phaeosphaeria sp. MPI-PUGE-AT-0046c]|nr:hypothetical protein DE146DRAFT_209055 [Phaeosphaeria sp. MPI-PUGE-AT-0046c]
MLFKPAIIAAFAALACASPFPQDDEVPTLAVGLEMTLKWFSHTTCSHSGGPDRGYSEGACLPLSDTDHGVKIRKKKGSCKLHAYSSKDCKKGTGVEVYSTTECHSLKGIWSVKIEDC